MKEIYPISGRFHPFVSAFMFLLVTLLGFVFLGPLLGGLFAMPFFDGSLEEFSRKIMDPVNDPSMKGVLFLLQGFATGVGLVVVPILYIKYLESGNLKTLFYNSTAKPIALMIVFFIVMTFMVVNSIFIEWNEGLKLPESLSGLEAALRAREEVALKVTKYLTTFDSGTQFMVGLFVIAVLPAIGEELVFRGFIQHELQAGFKNKHLAIWVSAILFSGIHMQFFGFVPRMLLGALFGYLYVWSGNLLYPIAAHFVQNGSQLILLYLTQKGFTEINVDDPESFPWSVILSFSLVTFILLYYFRAYFRKTEKSDGRLAESL